MAVEIEWIDSTSPAATGNKIYRDTVPSTGEVEIADIANGVQFYSDSTVEEGTEYKFEVQAHDGAGDETTQEVEGTNMDYITTAGGSDLELYEDNTAASIGTEADSIGTWLGNTNPAFAYVDSVGIGVTSPHSGDYCIQAYYDGGGTGTYIAYYFQVTSGLTYNIDLYAKRGVGSTNEQCIRIYDVDGDTHLQDVLTTSWVNHTWSIVATNTGTASLRVFTTRTTPGITETFVDTISITES